MADPRQRKQKEVLRAACFGGTIIHYQHEPGLTDVTWDVLKLLHGRGKGTFWLPGVFILCVAGRLAHPPALRTRTGAGSIDSVPLPIAVSRRQWGRCIVEFYRVVN